MARPTLSADDMIAEGLDDERQFWLQEEEDMFAEPEDPWAVPEDAAPKADAPEPSMYDLIDSEEDESYRLRSDALWKTLEEDEDREQGSCYEDGESYSGLMPFGEPGLVDLPG